MTAFGNRFVLVPSLVIALNLIGAVSAQESRPPIVHVTRVKADAEDLDAYLKFLKERALPAYQSSTLQWLHAWRVWPYGEGPSFLFATEVPNFAAFDGPHPLSKVMSEAELSAFQSEMNRTPQCCSLRISLRACGDKRWSFLRQDSLPAMKKAGVEAYLSHSVLFGEGADLFIVVMQPNFASLDKGHPVMQSYGPEVARSIFARADHLFVDATVITLRYMPDLSFDKRGD